jgi:quercetin dioxygenase-like cupin family protein
MIIRMRLRAGAAILGRLTGRSLCLPTATLGSARGVHNPAAEAYTTSTRRFYGQKPCSAQNPKSTLPPDNQTRPRRHAMTTDTTQTTSRTDSVSDPSDVAPIALGAGEGEALWFLGQLVTIKSSSGSTGGRVGVTETLGPRGSGSPLHVHHNEDEWFYVIDGELTFWVGGQVIAAPAGSFVYGPREIPHTFTVSSEQARFLLVVEPAGFEGFVRALGQPAQELVIPPPATEPPDVEGMARLAGEYGIEILGPPGIPA